MAARSWKAIAGTVGRFVLVVAAAAVGAVLVLVSVELVTDLLSR